MSKVKVGDRVVCDTNSSCGHCKSCTSGKLLFCENLEAKGVTTDGGFAVRSFHFPLGLFSPDGTGYCKQEYSFWNESMVYPIHNLTDIEATLVEPASCAIHGADVLRLAVGSTVFVFRG